MAGSSARRDARSNGGHRKPASGLRLIPLHCSRAGLLRGTALQAAAMVVLVGPAAAQLSPSARPTGGQVSAGQASIGGNASTTLITQTSQNASINWQSYNIGSGQTVQYVQPNASSLTLNRVLAANPSIIAGRILANGQIILVNQSGVVFTRGSQVDTAGLIVTTAGISDQNFMGGHLIFNQPGRPGAGIANAGNITISQAGLAALVAPQVSNSGTITAQLGRVVLGGAVTHTLDLYGDGLVALNVTGQVTQASLGGQQVAALVTNTGTILAPGGTIVLSASAVDGVVTNLVSAGGTIAAPSVGAQTGRVLVQGVGGGIIVDGAVSATGVAAGTVGGQVEVNASGGVVVAPGGSIDASGDSGGGLVALGTTAAHAANPSVAATLSAASVMVAQGGSVRANATRRGNGGRISVVGTATLTQAGTLTALGGATSGDGGNITLQTPSLLLTGAIDERAAFGQPGRLGISLSSTVKVEDTCGGAQCLTYQQLASGNYQGTLTTTGSADINLLFTAGDTVAGSNTLSIPRNDAGLAVDLTAGGDINIDSGVTVIAPSITLTAGGNVNLATSRGGGGAMGPSLLQALGGAVDITATAGNITLGNINTTAGDDAGTVSVQAPAGLVTETPGNGAPAGTVDASTLFVAAGNGRVDLESVTNAIGTLGASSASTDFTLSDGTILRIGGLVSGTVVSLSSTVGIELLAPSSVSGGTGISAQTIDLSAPSIKLDAPGTVAGGIGLVATDTISLQADSFALAAPVTATDLVAIGRLTTGALNVGGPDNDFGAMGLSQISAGTLALGTLDGVTLDTATSAIFVSGALAPLTAPGGTVPGAIGLFADGAIDVAGAVTASTVFGAASGSSSSVTFSGHNDIAALGDFSATGSFTFTDAADLEITGTVMATGGDLVITTSTAHSGAGSDLTIASTGSASGADVTLTASGAIVLNGEVSATATDGHGDLTGTLALQANGGGISENTTAGSLGLLSGGTLAAMADGPIDLENKNVVGVIGSSSALSGLIADNAGFIDFRDIVALNVEDAVKASGGAVTLTDGLAQTPVSLTIGADITGLSVTASASGALTQTAGTIEASDGALILTAKSGDLDFAGTVQAGTLASGAYTQSAALEADGGSITEETGGILLAGTLAAKATGASNSIDLAGANTIAVIGTAGALSGLTAPGAITLNDDGLGMAPLLTVSANITGSVVAITASGAFTQSAGMIDATAGALSITTGNGDLDVAGIVRAATSVDLTAAKAFTQSAGTIEAMTGHLSITAGNGDLDVAGMVQAATSVDLTAAKAFTQSAGTIEAMTGPLSITASNGNLDVAGTVQAGTLSTGAYTGTLTLTADRGGIEAQTGTLLAGTLTGAALTGSGDIDLTSTANTIATLGNLNAATTLQFIDQTGFTIAAGDTVSAASGNGAQNGVWLQSTGGGILILGTVQSGTGHLVTSGTGTWTAYAGMLGLSASGAIAENGGVVDAGTVAAVSSGSSITLGSMSNYIGTLGAVTITDATTQTSNGASQVTASGGITVVDDTSILSPAQSVGPTLAVTTLVQAGAGDTLELEAAALNVHGSGTGTLLTAGGTILLQANAFTLAGNVSTGSGGNDAGLVALDLATQGNFELGGPSSTIGTASLAQIDTRTLEIGSFDAPASVTFTSASGITGNTQAIDINEALALNDAAGTLGLFTSGNITGTGTITAGTVFGYAGGSASLNVTTHAPGGVGMLGSFLTGQGFDLNDATNLQVLDGALVQGGSGTLTIAVSGTGSPDLTLGTNTGATLLALDDVSLSADGDIVQNGGLVQSTSGDVGITAGGAVTQTGGVVQASTGDVAIAAGGTLAFDGIIEAGGTLNDATFAPGTVSAVLLTAGGDITEAVGSGPVTGQILAGTLTAQAGGTLDLANAAQGVAGANQFGTIASIGAFTGLSAGTGNLDVTDMASLTLAGGASMTAANGNLVLTVGGASSPFNLTLGADSDGTITGGTVTAQTVSVTDAGTITQYGGTLQASAGDAGLVATAGDFVQSGGLIEASLDTTVSATGAIEQTNATILAGRDADATATGFMSQNAGTITAGRTATVDTDGSLTQTSSLIHADGTAFVTAQGDIGQQASVISAGQDADVFAGGSITQSSSVISGNHGVSVTAGQDITSIGSTLISQGTKSDPTSGTVTVSTGGNLDFDGLIQGGGTLNGQIFAPYAGSAVLLSSSGDIAEAVNGGAVTGQILAGSLAASAGTTLNLANTALGAAGNQIGTIAGLSSGQVTLAGLTAGGAIALFDATTLTIADGALVSATGAGSDIAVTTGGTYDLTVGTQTGATITAAQDVALIAGGTLTQNGGAVTASGGNVALSALGGDVAQNGGTVAALDDATITALGNVTQTAGAIAAGGTTSITAQTGSVSQDGGSIAGALGLNVTAAQDVSSHAGTLISQLGDVTLVARAGSLSFDGLVEAGGTLNGGVFDPGATSTVLLSAGGGISEALGAAPYTGRILAGTLAATAGASIILDTQDANQIGNIAAVSGNAIDFAGLVAADGSVALSDMANLTVQDGAQILARNGQVSVALYGPSGGPHYNLALGTQAGATLQAQGAITIAATGTISQTGGLIETAQGTIILSGTTVTQTGGTIDSAMSDVTIVAGSGGFSQSGAALVTAASSLTVQTQGGITLAASTLTAGQDLTLQAGTGGNGGGIVIGTAQMPGGDLIQAGSVIAMQAGTAGIVQAAGNTISAPQSVALQSGGGIALQGTLLTNTLAASAGGAIDMTGAGNQIAVIGTAGSLTGLVAPSGITLVDGTDVLIAAPVTATGGAIAITGAGNLTANAGVAIAGELGVRLEAADAVTLAGSIAAGAGPVTVTGGSILAEGSTNAGGDVAFTAQAGFADVAGATVTASGAVSIDAASIALAGGLTSGGLTTLSAAGAVTNAASSRIAASGAVSESGATITLDGVVAAGGTSSFTAGGAFLEAAGASTTGATGLSVGAGSITVDGALSSGGDASLESQGLVIEASGATLTAIQAVSVSGAAVTIDGQVQAGGTARFSTGGAFVENAGATIEASQGLAIAGDGVTIGGVAQSDAGAATIGGSTIAIDGTLRAAGAASLTALGSVAEAAGAVIQGGQAVSVHGSAISIDGTVGATGQATLAAGGAFNEADTGGITAGGIAISAEDAGVAGALTAPRITLLGSRSVTLTDGVIDTASSLPGTPATYDSVTPLTSGNGLFVSSANFTQNGGTTIGASPGSGPYQTVQITITGTGVAHFDSLVAPSSELILNLLYGGSANGKIDVAGLDVINPSYTLGQFYTPPVPTRLFGTVGRFSGTEAASVSFSERFTNINYQLNGCAIESLSCVLLSPVSLPVFDPAQDYFVGSVRRNRDDDDALPNVGEEDY